ncbi:MAG: ParB/RepB/Spo0J family partition protein [Alphaproteobacteria bacterium]|nr:ParB/RepB/Spo0J family partition protein [Alphaproteobacteria bacterium]
MNDTRKQVLGRGLSSLLGASSEEENTINQSPPLEVPIRKLEAGLNQPRRTFPEVELKDLSLSIKDKGVLQPILVRMHPRIAGQYEIIAGERRWRAAELANLKTVPVIVREFSDAEALEVGLLENLQRQDLDPIDEAYGYHRLAEEFSHTQETISRIVGRSRSHIANTLRLLTLTEKIKNYLKNGQLSAGHGRALIGCENPDLLAEMIIERNLNVRQAETLAKHGFSKTEGDSIPKASDPEKEIIRQQINDILGIPVDLTLKGLGGKIVIHFKNPNELDQIMKRLNSISGEGLYPSVFLN